MYVSLKQTLREDWVSCLVPCVEGKIYGFCSEESSSVLLNVSPQIHAMPSSAAFIKIVLNLVIKKTMSFEVYSLRSTM